MDLSVLGRDPGGIIPFRWAASSRFGGRHHSVTMGDIISFWWAASPGISRPAMWWSPPRPDRRASVAAVYLFDGALNRPYREDYPSQPWGIEHEMEVRAARPPQGRDVTGGGYGAS